MGVALVSNFLIIMQNTVDSSPEKCQGNRPDTNCIFFARAPDCTGFQQIASAPKKSRIADVQPWKKGARH